MKERLERLQRSTVGRFATKLMDDEAPNLASLLAWGTLTALLPMLLGILSLAGIVLRDPRMLDQVYATVLALLPTDTAAPLISVIQGVRDAPAGSVGLIALLLLLFNGSAFFANMTMVFDRAYHAPDRNPIVDRAIALVMLLVTTVLLIVATLAAGIGGLLDNFPGILPIGQVVTRAAGWSIAILSTFLLFVLVYRVLPNVQQGWRDVIPGSILATSLLLIVSQVFPLYLKIFPPNQAYAVFGVFLVFTIWLYVTGFAIVLGAELNAFLQHGEDRSIQESKAVQNVSPRFLVSSK